MLSRGILRMEEARLLRASASGSKSQGNQQSIGDLVEKAGEYFGGASGEMNRLHEGAPDKHLAWATFIDDFIIPLYGGIKY